MRTRKQHLGDAGCALVESCLVINGQGLRPLEKYRSGYDLVSKIDDTYVVEVKTKTTNHPVHFSASQSRCIKNHDLGRFYFLDIVRCKRDGCKILVFSRFIVLKHTKDERFDWCKVRHNALLRCKIDNKGEIEVRHARAGCHLRLRSLARHQTAARRRLL